MDTGGTHGGTVDGGVGTNLHIVVNQHIAHLRDLLIMSILLWRKAEAVGTDDRTCMKDATFAYHSVAVQLNSRVERGAVADDATVTYIHLRVDLDIVADASMLSDEGKFPKIEVVATLR